MAISSLTKPVSADTATAIVGTTSTDDILFGTSGDDVITGGTSATGYTADGIDVMQGGTGDDRYIVNDSVTVGAVTTTDTIIEYANEGIDTVYASVNYTLPSEVENIVSTLGAVTLTGNALANTLDGSQGTASAADILVGKDGNDTYIIGTGDIVNEGISTGTDTIISKVAATLVDLTLTGTLNVENVTLDTAATTSGITGNAKNNTLTGNASANSINGGAGNDILDGGFELTPAVIAVPSGPGIAPVAAVAAGVAATDILTGGLGNDTYIQRSLGTGADTFTELFNQGIDTIISFVTSGTVTASANIENVTLMGANAVDATGNALSNIIKGNSGANVLQGGAGTVTDTLYGLQGNDTLNGNAGADFMIGGRGDDTYTVDITGDVVTEVSGTAAGVADTVNGSADLVNSFVSYSLNNTAAAGVEKLTLIAGAAAALNATGNALNNTLLGNSNANILDGKTGVDTMTGGSGNDTYIVDNADLITEAATSGEVDSVISSAATFALPANVEKITLSGTANLNATVAAANTANVTMTGNSGVNTITGGAGGDSIFGGAGDDVLSGGAGNDSITGGTGLDTVTLGSGQDTINFAGGVADTNASADSVAGIDVYTGLTLNSGTGDLINLTAVVATVNTNVSGTVAEATFITDMNALLNVGGGAGFNTTVAGDISAAVVTATTGGGGVATNDKFLVVDLDHDGTFTEADFVIEITGATITTLNVNCFI